MIGVANLKGVLRRIDSVVSTHVLEARSVFRSRMC